MYIYRWWGCELWAGTSTLSSLINVCTLWSLTFSLYKSLGSSYLVCLGVPSYSLRTYPAFIIQNLDLSRVAQFDHGSHGDVELPARFEVQPYIVPLDYKALVKDCSKLQYGTPCCDELRLKRSKWNSEWCFCFERALGPWILWSKAGV